MAVLCLGVIRAQTAGILYTRDPKDRKLDALWITATRGLGLDIASGQVPADLFVVDRKWPHRVVEQSIVAKEEAVVLAENGGVLRRPTSPEEASTPSLNPRELALLADWSLRIEKHFGVPQDIEWARDERGQVWIVQARPLALVDSPQTRSKARVKGEPLLAGGRTVYPGRVSGSCVSGQRFENLGRYAARRHFVLAQVIAGDRDGFPPHFRSGGRDGKCRGPRRFPAARSQNSFDLRVGRRLRARQGRRSHQSGRGAAENLFRNVVVAADRRNRKSASGTRNPASKLTRSTSGCSCFICWIPRLPTSARQAASPRTTCCGTATRRRWKRCSPSTTTCLEGDLTCSKKLMTPVPVNIYVLDLGGGLALEDPSASEVRPSEIVSWPFQALWRGLTHPGVSWQREMPASLSDLASVMANSLTTSTSAMRALGDRSYLLVADEYINLNSRLAYHFTLVDACLSQVASHNYISFRFAGGGATPYRRNLRACFVEACLAHYGFLVDRRSDLVNAWFKKAPAEETESRLNIIGRLMACTSQLDMYMTSNAVMRRYVQQFLDGNYTFAPTDEAEAKPALPEA